jgi:hypothetical protein
VYEGHASLASVFIPVGLLLTGWILMLLLARRNERKVRSEWEVLLRDAWETEISENVFWEFYILICTTPRSWAIFSSRTPLDSKMVIPGFIRFLYAALFDFLPVRCWICLKLTLQRNAKYRKDDMQHFLEEAAGSLQWTEVSWLPRAYCSECFKALGFEPHQGSRTNLKHKP